MARLPGMTLALKTLLLTLLMLLISAAFSTGDEIHFVMWKPDHPEVWNKLISKFERQTGIKVHVDIGPNSSTAAHALISQRLKNADPDLDVFMMDVIWPSEFVSAHWIQALDRYFPSRDRADFFPAAISACTINGKIYGVPFETSGGILFCRKDLLDKYAFKPPETWDQLVQEAERIVSRERPQDPALRGYCGQFKQYEGLVCNMQEFLLSNRGKLFSDNGQKSTIGSPANLQAVRFVRDKIIGKVASRGVLTYEEPESLHVFIQGHAVFLRDWPYAWEIANNPKESAVAGKVDIIPLPHFAGGVSAPTLGGWQFALSRFSRRKALAWQFVQYMSSPSVQKIFALKASQRPARRSVYNDPEVLKKNPHFAKLRKAFEKARPRPAIPLYPLYSSILQRFYQDAIVYPDSRVEPLAAEADREIDRLLKLVREGNP
ncbi:MAG: ABC transporter substrate-binding protein [Desulfomonilaceae bacterium]